MSLLQQIIIQLTVGISAFIAGLFLQRIRATWFYLQSRRFWRPLLRRDLMVILGDGFSGLRRFEASDVIGRGDLVASYELVTQFSRMGFRRLQPIFADRIIDDQPGRSLRHNMIILGGPDANSVSLACLASIEVSYRLIWPKSNVDESTVDASLRQPQLVLTRPAEQNERLYLQPSVQGGNVIQDYGVIIRTRNPFEPWGRKGKSPRSGKRVVIMYGCYGYGTLAAVLYSQTKDFLEMVKNRNDDIECVVTCSVVMGTPQTIGYVYFRKYPYGYLSQHSAPTGMGSSLDDSGQIGDEEGAAADGT